MYHGLGFNGVDPYVDPEMPAAGITAPAVVTQIGTAIGQGKNLYETLRDILNPREAQARRAAELAAQAEAGQRTVPVVAAGVPTVPIAPLVVAGLALALLAGGARKR